MSTDAPLRVLVTGCSTGIGRTTATVLAQRGHEVIATARRPEALSGLDVAKALPLDVTPASRSADPSRRCPRRR